jgi:DNA-binding NarL/FixJ family response regulator
MAEGRILIVEDEHIVAMGIKRMLKNLGFMVTGVASSGEDAISKAESTLPDLVLMDIILKGDLDGIEASKDIISRLDIPVIYLTACSDSEIVERARNTGSFGCIVKPFDETDLKRNIDIVLTMRRMEKNIVEKDQLKFQKDSEKFGTLPGSRTTSL